MYINQLEIYNFRAFSGKKQEQDENGNIVEKDIRYKFNFVKGLNCIAGHNGIGKSTILAMLGNCGELKKGIATHLNGSQFRGDYKDIIKGKPAHNKKEKVCTLHFSELPSYYNYSETYVERLEFRATFQDNNTRYRLIPVQNEHRITEGKLRWPVYYMGLSRLYPIGESSAVSDTILPKDITNEIKDIYSKIIPSKYDYKTVSKVNISETNKKQGVGVSTEKYSYEANSAGQDNIGQILLSVLSFKKLKEKLGNEYFGGLLLIDEIDASLHPAAQLKLLDYLYNQSQELSLQIIFTSHSINVIEHLIIMKNNKLNVGLVYIDTLRGSLNINFNPTLNYVYNNLTESYNNLNFYEKILLLSEDDVGRDFLQKILEYKQCPNISRLNIADIHFGWEQLVSLVKQDFSSFSKVIIVLDPDLNNNTLYSKLKQMLTGSKYKINEKNSSIFILPGNDYIEKIVWKWFENVEENHPIFFDRNFSENGLGKQNIINNGPYSGHYSSFTDDKKKIKEWYKDVRYYANIALKHIIQEYDEAGQLDEFYNNFNNFLNMLIHKRL